ncbi:MAG: hypothetical protein ABS79_00605 [Planctomycetes bacterium SCN 63-9]|nr:MAG: hypothetical protein ABS79_00605 [Planctomycetes bacterium SCN 63-9]
MIFLRHPFATFCFFLVLGASTFAAEPLPPMLRLPGTGEDPAAIEFAALPVLGGEHAVVSRGDKTWPFRLHSYLAFHDGKYWCMWSHGPVIEDHPTQHVRYATSDDGLKWSEPGHIVGPSPREGFRYISRGLWIRDGRLIALASHDEAFDAKGKVHFFGKGLQLMGFEWDGSARRWKPLGVVFDGAINNFPPARLPNGEWGMICRGPDYRRDVFMLTGGVASLSTWTRFPIVTEAPPDGFRPEEPDWWTLPDGRLLGLFRDNARSGRFYRAVSADNGHSWSAPEKTNFPDATSKFFGLRTSRGVYVLVSNANPRGRNPLCLSTSDDGVTFTRLARLPIPERLREDNPDADARKSPARPDSLQYPHAIEHDNQLLIAFSRKKQVIEVVRVSLDEIDRLRHDTLGR